MSESYDAIMIVTFGGPDGMDDVVPFLENVLRGKNVPEERKLEVLHHYELFGGKSPINEQNEELRAKLQAELTQRGIDLPVVIGNRNWKPFIKDTLAELHEQGRKRVLMYFTSAYSSYSGCRQYRENLLEASEQLVGNTPVTRLLRKFYNHPNFIEVNRLHIANALAEIPEDRRSAVHLAFTAHSIPISMSDHCNYVKQLMETCQLTAEAAGIANWKLVYQSRSGPPHQPWLEPDICDHLAEVKEQGITDVIISPIGFVSDHLEVLFDLDTEARECCDELGITLARAKTAGNHTLMIEMIAELIEDRMSDTPQSRCLGNSGPSHDICPKDCCLNPRPVGRPG